MGRIQGLASVSSGRPAYTPSAELSPQQLRIMAQVKDPLGGNLLVEARAGTGKTFTLLEICKVLDGTATFLAFNKAISEEIKQRLAAAGISDREVKASTMHSVGFQAWVRSDLGKRSARNVRGEKLRLLADKIMVPKKFQGFAVAACSLAKQHVVGAVLDLPIDDTDSWLPLVEHYQLIDTYAPQSDWELDEEQFLEEALAWSLRLLKQSIVEAETLIDYDDMIYMPLYHNLRFWQYDWVLIDEAQDTNRARREIAMRLLKPGGRLIAVGDPYQAIYGFTGADADALDLIAAEFQCQRLPLTTTYRCAAAIVREAQKIVPDIEAREGAPEGVVESIELPIFQKIIPDPADAILCRNTAPLVEIAFGYLRRRIGCVIEGKDIGASLISFVRRWKRPNNLGDLLIQLEEHLTSETSRLLAQYKEAQAAALDDRVSTLRVLIKMLGYDQPISALTELIDSMFKDSDKLPKQVITLSTCHKAKGREWDRVYLLGRNAYMPSAYAKQEWQLAQESNLEYVAITRAKHSLIHVVVPHKPRR